MYSCILAEEQEWSTRNSDNNENFHYQWKNQVRNLKAYTNKNFLKEKEHNKP